MTNQKNGNTATAPKENGKTISVLTVVPETEISKQLSSSAIVAPLDDRLKRMNELFELQKKYNRLLSSKQKLAEFKMVKGEENITLSIEDGNSRKEFTTSNSDVVKEVMEFVSTKIDQRRKEIEPLLVW